MLKFRGARHRNTTAGPDCTRNTNMAGYFNTQQYVARGTEPRILYKCRLTIGRCQKRPSDGLQNILENTYKTYKKTQQNIQENTCKTKKKTLVKHIRRHLSNIRENTRKTYIKTLVKHTRKHLQNIQENTCTTYKKHLQNI